MCQSGVSCLVYFSSFFSLSKIMIHVLFFANSVDSDQSVLIVLSGSILFAKVLFIGN